MCSGIFSCTLDVLLTHKDACTLLTLLTKYFEFSYDTPVFCILENCLFLLDLPPGIRPVSSYLCDSVVSTVHYL